MADNFNAFERFLAIIARIPGLDFLEDRRLEMRNLKQRIDNKLGDIEGDKNAVVAAGDMLRGSKKKKPTKKKPKGGKTKKRKRPSDDS